MVKYYFELQIKMLGRQLKDYGVHPIVAIVLGLLAFVLLSFYFYTRIENASYFYPLISVLFLCQFITGERNTFLSNLTKKKDFLTIRLLENLAVVLPFVVFMLYKGDWLQAIISLVIASALIFLKLNQSINLAIPTPFGRRPYEFLVGFRVFFLLLVVVFILFGIGLFVANYNLSLFCIVLVFWICMGFYAKQERKYLVWIHNVNARKFLADKVKTALLYGSLLCLPLAIILIIYNPTEFYLVLIAQLVGAIYLIAAVFGKYAAFPDQMNIAGGILFGIGFCFPPFLLIVIPIFYKQSLKHLEKILL